VNKSGNKAGAPKDAAPATTKKSKSATGKIKEQAAENKSASVSEELPEIAPAPIVKEANVQVFRYSDEELIEFKTLINERLDAAREELQFLQGQMIGKDPNGVEDSSDLRLSLEDGSGAMDREQLSQLTSRQVMFISNLEKALIRIHNKTYGVCRETGKLIEKARLRAVPHATLSMEAKKKAPPKKH
jgi:RNA polymerase-binding transcription factor DksA